MVNYGAGQEFDFNADVFFYVVLPPIIFHQGYALKKRNFFKYFHYIFSFGFLGTVIQFITITILALYASKSKYMSFEDDGVPIGLTLHECMLMAAVFSAADEVATLSLIKQNEYPKLSAVLFGEGVLNDAMSILLFHTVRSGEQNPDVDSDTTTKVSLPQIMLQALWVLASATAIGMGSGLLISRLLKSLDSLKSSPVRQVAILMLGGYLSFSLSEALDLSGILAVFFCGLTLSHYAWHSLAERAQTASKITSDTISMVAEAYCFAAVGLSVHEFDASQWCWGFIVAMILVLMIARALSVYGICLIGSILFPKSFQMPIAEQHVLFFGGLVRGAIAWAQVVQVHDAHRGVMITTSLGVILFTTVFFGAVMPFFTRGLKPEQPAFIPAPSAFQYNLPGEGYGSIGDSTFDPYSMASFDNASVFSAASSVINPDSMRGIVHRLWNGFDNRFMRGMFGGKPHDNTSIIYDSQFPSNASAVHAAGMLHLNPALHPGETSPHPHQHPPPHLFPLSGESRSVFSLHSGAGGSMGFGGGVGTGNAKEETKGGGGFGSGQANSAAGAAGMNGNTAMVSAAGGVGAVPPDAGPSGGQPI
ncbi:unnamed protein product [Ascophyllum nodosum]